MTNWMRASLAFAKRSAGHRRAVYHASQPVVVSGEPSEPVAEYIELLAATRKSFWYAIKPVAKPRMTRRDKWQTRPCVASYRVFKDCCRDASVRLPASGATVIFCLPMPKSWSAKRRGEMDGTEHRQTPDLDNMIKALMDATRAQDSVVSSISAYKIWSQAAGFAVIWPRIEICAKATQSTC